MNTIYKYSLAILSLLSIVFVNGQVTEVFTANGTFTVPCGVTSIEVDCWGGGGAGGAADMNNGKGAGGGGGGAHATKTLAVTAGQTYTITRGAGGVGNNNGNGGNGGNTTFTGPGGTVVAQGGTGGAEANGGAASAGTSGIASSNGTPATAGNNGGAGSAASAGAGGAAALMAGIGGGAAGPNGGNGGNGGNATDVGGGGGGGFAGNNSDRRGGDGFRGEVWITYTPSGPGNDAVCNATNLLVNGTTLAGQTNCGATSLWSGGCVPAGNTEVWYTVTITAGNNALTVNFPTQSFGGGNVNIQIATNNVPCPANTSMTLADSYCGAANVPILLDGLSPGTYYMGVSTTAANQGAFTINATQSFVSPAPFDPCDAIVVASNYCSGATAHSNVGAPGNAFPNNFFNDFACGDNNENEVYFKFVATHTSMDITALKGSIGGANAEITILQSSPDTDCNGAYSVIASSCPAWGTVANFLNQFVVGQTYYIVVDHKGNNGAEGTFGLCLEPYTFVPPAGTGFTCATAIPITTPFVDISTTVGAGNNWISGCATGFANLIGNAAVDILDVGQTTMDKFYSITVPAGGGYYDYSLSVRNNSLGVNSWPAISFVTECPALNDFDFGDAAPNSNNFDLCYNLNDAVGDGTNSDPSNIGYGGDIPCTGIWLEAGNYFVVIDHSRVIYDGSTFNGFLLPGVPTGYEYEFSMSELSQATNNECAGAANIASGVTQNGNNAGCNYSYGPNDPNSSDFCAFSTENLAWFSFTTAAGQTSVDLTLTNVSGDVQWGIVQGPCGGPYTSAGANALNTPPDGYSAALDPCDRVSTPSYNTTITGLTANTQYWFVADGNAGTPSSFDISMTNITLPIEYKSFDIENKINHILLSWATAVERDNDYFTIERSYDGVNFEIIGKLDGSGTSSSERSYEFQDFDIKEKGVRYYRIKQTDFNYVYSYTDTKIVYLETITVAISPNPVSDEMEVLIDSYSNVNTSKIEIYDITGAVIYTYNDKLSKGVNKLNVNTSNFAPGMYYISIENNNEIIKERFIKK